MEAGTWAVTALAPPVAFAQNVAQRLLPLRHPRMVRSGLRQRCAPEATCASGTPMQHGIEFDRRPFSGAERAKTQPR